VQLFAVPQNGERVRAQAAAYGFGQGDDGSGRNGGIHRVAALEHHAQAGLCGQRVRGRDHIARKQGQARAGVGELVVEVHVIPR